jgi:uncharacterized protein (TIGR02996 family)
MPDDEQRLVYAAWLDAQGDTQGRLPRLDLTLAGLPLPVPEAAALRGPVTRVIFPGQGYGGPYVYADPERWDTTVRSFLDGL